MTKTKKIAWYCYMVVYVAICLGSISAIYMFNDIYGSDIYNVFWVSLLIASIFGLNGYIVKAKYFNSYLWKIIFILFMLTYCYEAYMLLGISNIYLVPLEACRYGLLVPIYIAIFNYAFASDETIWHRAHNRCS